MKNGSDNNQRKSNKMNSQKGRKSIIQKEEEKEEKILYKSNHQASEGIIKLILDKIIISAIRSSQSREIEDELGNFCFNNFKRQLTSLFETNYINYSDDLINSEPKLLWNFIPPPDNTWVEIKEPGTQEMDRYESSNIEYVEIKKD